MSGHSGFLINLLFYKLSLEAMQITLNGKPHTLEKPINILEFSEILRLEPTRVAVERNREIVPRSLYSETMLKAGDELEIVTFIGGG